MFLQDLVAKLTLTIEGASHEVPGGQIRFFDLDVRNWGFDAEVEFFLSNVDGADSLFSDFSGKKLIEASFQVEARYKPSSSPPDPLKLQGIVTEKGVRERVFEGVEGRPVLERTYWIRFSDPAQVIWRQHFPCDLKVDSTMQALVDAHKGAKISIAYDWPAMTATHKILFIGLGADGNEASFYDFLLWFVRREGGVFSYDAAANAYKLSATKPAAGTAAKLAARDVSRVEAIFPETRRHTVHVLNASTEHKKDETIQNSDAVTGCRLDVLARTSVAAHFDARKTVETGKFFQREPELALVFRRFPTITFAPGTLVDFSSPTWSDAVFHKSGTWRVRELRVEASADRPERASEEETAPTGQIFERYRIDCRALLEKKEEKHVSLPPFRMPRWPVLLEGKVVSEQGQEAEETYQIYTDSSTSVDQYKVKVPLFSDAVVAVDYNPNLLPGHFYFPAFKNARVLLSMEFQQAWIKRYLEWRPGARLPMDGQGNHLLVGISDKSQTSISHAYVDNKPVLSVKRLLQKDTELIKMEEGILLLQTREEEGQ